MWYPGRRTILGLLFLLVSLPSLAQDPLEWQFRGSPDRHEGLQPRLKAAHLDLLSAAVLHKQSPLTPESPRQAYLHFYLAEETPVFITVRSYGPHPYWMQPEQREWSRGWHSFAWPMEAVLLHLEPVPQVHRLGVVARVGEKMSNQLAPIVIHEGNEPPPIKGYRFVFRPPDSADAVDVEWGWYRMEGVSYQPMGKWKSPQNVHSAGIPFHIDWHCLVDGEPREEGWYLLHVTGLLKFPSRDEELNETYRLYHQPSYSGLDETAP